MNSLTYVDARAIALARCFGNVWKVKIEDHFRLIYAVWKHEVRIHSAVIPVDHDVGVNPVIERSLALTYGARQPFGAFSNHRAPLQAEVLAVFDHVPAVVEHAVESFVQMRHVIAAVEIVIHKDFPVAVKDVMAAFHPVKVAQIKRTNLIDQLGAKKVFKGVFSMKRFGARAFQSDEHPLLPHRSLHRHETISRSIKVADTSEIRSAFQLAFQRISPTMIGTTELVCVSFGFSHDGGRMMATDVKKAAQSIVVSPNGDNRFAGDLGGNVLSWF